MELEYLGARLLGIEGMLTTDDRKGDDGDEW